MSPISEPTTRHLTRLGTPPPRHALGVALSGGLLVSCAVAVVVYAALPAARETLYVTVGWTAAFAGVVGVVVHRPARRLGWLAMSGGVGLWALGDQVWLLYPGLGPFPSAADAFYLLGYGGLATGLIAMARSHGASRDSLLAKQEIITRPTASRRRHSSQPKKRCRL